jgi:ribosome-associated translation inhibitor RaiA
VAGSLADLNKARVGGDFIDDVSKELRPNKFAFVAEIQEDWTTPVDDRMEALGGFVFRRALSDVKHMVNDEDLEALKADLAQLKGEHAEARADRKTKLHEKINQLESKIQARLEKAKERREAAEQQAKAKVELLKAKAAALKAKTAETHH